MIRRRMTVKRVDPWSVLKLGLVVNIAGAAILVVTGMVVWSVVRRLMLVERVCEQAEGLLGFENCAVDGVTIMRSGLMLAGLSVVVATGVMVFLAFLYNLIADLTGGIEVSMLDHSGRARASGGVEVSPELRRDTGRTRAPSPASERAAAIERSDPHPTMASARARPQADEPQVDVADAPPPEPAGPRGPSVLERATGVVGAAGAAVKEAAEKSGAAVKGAADKTGAKLSEAGRRATVTLADVTEREAAERAERARAQRQALDQLAMPDRSRRTGGSSGPAGDGSDTPPRGPDGRFLPSDRARSSGSRDRGSGSRDRGSESRRSPQEAAAERQRARAARDRAGSNSRGNRRSPRSRDDEPELIFGQHPRNSDDKS